MLIESTSDDLQMLREVTRRIAETRVAPLVAGIEERGEFSDELLDVLRDAGWLGMPVPAEYGGDEADLLAFVVVMEELSKVFPTASTMLTPHWFAVKVLARSGAGPWLDPLLRAVAAGELLGALAMTEPGAGSDLNGARTTAVADGDEWVVQGSKRFITNGGHCDFYLLLARAEDGLSLFYVEADRPGISVGRMEKKMGLRGSATAELFFDDLRVPTDHLVGEVGAGFGLAMDAFIDGRVLVAALSVGIAEGALRHAVDYAKGREQFGRPIAAFQGLQFLIADMAIKTQTARSITYDAAEALRLGRPDASYLASIAKTVASDAAMDVTTDAVQVLGGCGYTTDFPVEMLMRDAKIQQIYEGTNQIQRMLIARELLGKAARG